MKIPAGMIDQNVEFFSFKGKLMILYDGKISSFDRMPAKVKYMLQDALEQDPDAQLCLDCLDLHDEMERLRQFVFCRFSSYDHIADLTHGGNNHPEFVKCERRGRCPYEGTLCRSLKDVVKISSRELQVIQCIAQDLENKMIADELDISVNTVTTHIQNICNKIGAHSKYGIVVWAFENDLIDENLINNNSLRKAEVGGDCSGVHKHGATVLPRAF